MFYDETEQDAVDRATRNAHTLYVLHTHLIAKGSVYGPSQLAKVSPFWLDGSPPISLEDFAERLGMYLNCSPEALVVAAEYMTRLFEVQPLLFALGTAHKLMLAMSVLGAKFTDDRFFTCSFYAEVGGVTPQVMALVEREAALQLKYGFWVSSGQFLTMRDRMETIRTMTVPAALAKTDAGSADTLRGASRSAENRYEPYGETAAAAAARIKNEELERATAGNDDDAQFSVEMRSPHNWRDSVDDFLASDRWGSPDPQDVVHRSVGGSRARTHGARTRGLVGAKPVRSAMEARPEPLHLGAGGRRPSWFGELPSLPPANDLRDRKSVV